MPVRAFNVFRPGLHFTYKSSGMLYIATVVELKKTKSRTYIVVNEFCEIKPIVQCIPLDITARSVTDITIIDSIQFRRYEQQLLV